MRTKRQPDGSGEPANPDGRPEISVKWAALAEEAQTRLAGAMELADTDPLSVAMQQARDRLSDTPPQVLSASLRDTMARLQRIGDEVRPVSIDRSYLAHAVRGLDPGVVASEAIRDQTASLLEMQAGTAQQIAALADLAQIAVKQQAEGIVAIAETHAESRRLRDTMTRFSVDAKTSGDRLSTLTWVLVILTLVIAALTGVLVAEALHLGPFAPADPAAHLLGA